MARYRATLYGELIDFWGKEEMGEDKTRGSFKKGTKKKKSGGIKKQITKVSILVSVLICYHG